MTIDFHGITGWKESSPYNQLVAQFGKLHFAIVVLVQAILHLYNIYKLLFSLLPV